MSAREVSVADLMMARTEMGAVDLAMAVFSQARNAVTPFEDVLPTLERLGSRAVLGSISNGFARNRLRPVSSAFAGEVPSA